MSKQSISFTKPNDEWLKAQVDSHEYSSKSEVVNDLIRQARNQQMQIDYIKAKIEKAEKSGFTKDSKEELLALFKQDSVDIIDLPQLRAFQKKVILENKK